MDRLIKKQGKKCIIIGAGDFDVEKISLNTEDLCIAADGGFRYCQEMQVTPDYLLGDFDSLTEEQKRVVDELEEKQSVCIKRLPVMKDDTDMLAAIKLGLEKGYKQFFLYGALGGKRFEHSLANIQCLQYLKSHGGIGYLVEKEQLLFLVKNETITLPKCEECFVSIFALSEKAEGVNLQQLKYELQDAVITNDFPIGVSNETEGKEAVISVKKGTLLVVLTKKK